MEERLVIRNGVVVTMDPAARILNGATVVVAGDRITAISDDPAVAEARADATTIDAQGCAVLPGLVNCHGHLRPMRAQGEGMDVRTWHTTIVDGISERMSHDDAYASDTAAVADVAAHMLGSGVFALERGLWFISAAHTDEDVEVTVAAAEPAIASVVKRAP